MVLTKSRADYYSRPYIILELVKQLKNRYLSVRTKNKDKPILVRYYLGYSYKLLVESLTRNSIYEDINSKLYYDLATYQDERGWLPMFSYNKEKRKDEKAEFSGIGGQDGDYEKYIKSYDFAIDIDSKDLKIAWKDAKKIKMVFDEYKLPYSLRFSGTKGFHFVIDSRFIDLKIKTLDMASYFGKIVANLCISEFGADKEGNPKSNVDFSIYDPRRVLKLAYSLCNNEGNEYVCLPLTDKQFDEFRYEDMALLNVMKNVRIKDRGLLERDFGLTTEQLKVNVSSFMEDYNG